MSVLGYLDVDEANGGDRRLFLGRRENTAAMSCVRIVRATRLERRYLSRRGAE